MQRVSISFSLFIPFWLTVMRNLSIFIVPSTGAFAVESCRRSLSFPVSSYLSLSLSLYLPPVSEQVHSQLPFGAEQARNERNQNLNLATAFSTRLFFLHFLTMFVFHDLRCYPPNIGQGGSFSVFFFFILIVIGLPSHSS